VTAAESVQPLPPRPSAHFRWEEFSCHDAIETIYPLDWRCSRGVPLANELERLRVLIGPFTPTSVYRTWDHHKAIYAAMRPPKVAPMNSQHLFGTAADVSCPAKMGWNMFVAHVRAVAEAEDSKIRYLKFYRGSFAHLDIRERKTLLVEYA